eukprot:11768158-Ditylum_brightwellii.AAC.1
MLSSSSSSKSSEEDQVDNPGKELQQMIDTFLAQENVTEEPNGVDCANTASVGDWKQRSTQATEATTNSIRVKEEPTIPKNVFVSNTE